MLHLGQFAQTPSFGDSSARYCNKPNVVVVAIVWGCSTRHPFAPLGLHRENVSKVEKYRDDYSLGHMKQSRPKKYSEFCSHCFSIQLIVFALLVLLPPSSSNLYPGSHTNSRLFSLLLTTVHALHFYRETDSALSSLLDSRRIVPTHAAGALDS